MKRDLDVIRELLIFFEDKEDRAPVEKPQIEGYEDSTIQYHLLLMYDAGLIRCESTRSSTSDRVISVLPFELTWEGHEFLSKVRSENVWARIKDVISSKGAALAFGVVNELATRYALRAVQDT